MRAFFYLLICLTLALSCKDHEHPKEIPADQPPKLSTKGMIEKTIFEYHEAWQNGDYQKIREITSPSFIQYDVLNQTRSSVDELISLAKTFPSQVPQFKLSNIRIKVKKNRASASYFNELTYSNADSTESVFFAIDLASFTAASDNQWKIDTISTTRMKKK